MGLTLLLGGESLLADRAISEILRRDPTATVTQMTAGEFEVGAISDALSPSLFGENTVVVIREINDLGADLSDEVAAYLEEPEDGVELVLWHKGGVKGKALLEKIKKLKPTLIACDVLKKDGEKADFIRDEFKRLGRKVSTEAVQALIDSLGSDLRELSGAVSQLASDTAQDKTIDEGVVARFQQGRVETRAGQAM